MKKLLVFVVLLAVGAAAAHHFGYLDRLGLGMPGGRLIPKDSKLLAYFRPDARELFLIQATEVDFRVSEESRRQLEQDWREFHQKTGIDVRKDVDALAAADGLGVVRGRFDWGRLAPYLETEGYTITELRGVPAAVKSRAADLALDGNYLLIGGRSELEQALARKQEGRGLESGSPIVKAIDDIGWKHTLVGAVVSGSRLSSQARPDMKLQSAVGALDSTPAGFELRAVAVTGSKEEGEALHAMLEMLRKAFLLEMALNPRPEARALRDALESATLQVDPQGRVSGNLRLPHTIADQATANVSRDQLASFQNLALADEADEPVTGSEQPSVTPTRPAPAPAVAATSATTPARLDWKPPVFGLILLVLSLVTMGAKNRPGLFNVLFHPLFLLPFLVATLGIFVFRWTGHSGGAFDLLTRPMPEWHRFVSFELAQPIALSAAIPMVFAILSGPVPLLRRFAAGLAVGFGGYLVTAAIAGAGVALIPPAYTVFWLVGNALAAVLLARLTIPQRVAKSSASPRPRIA
jgi:hypothetical protein